MVATELEQGFDVVADGPLFEPLALQTVLHAVPAGTAWWQVRLVATYEAALDRVSVDATRRLSKNPEFLRSAYDRAGPLLRALPAADWTFDTTKLRARRSSTSCLRHCSPENRVADLGIPMSTRPLRSALPHRRTGRPHVEAFRRSPPGVARHFAGRHSERPPSVGPRRRRRTEPAVRRSQVTPARRFGAWCSQ